jgi:hypothetical protein
VLALAGVELIDLLRFMASRVDGNEAISLFFHSFANYFTIFRNRQNRQ